MKLKEIVIAVLLAVLISFLYTTWRAHQTGAALVNLEDRVIQLEQSWMKR